MSLVRPLACLLVLVAPLAQAGLYADTLSGTSVEWEEVELPIEVAAVPATLDLTRVTASLVERNGERIGLGLRGGYVEVTSVDEVNLIGSAPHGGFLAGSLTFLAFERGPLRVRVQGEAGYTYTKDESATQKTSLRWREVALRASAAWRLGPVDLVAGVQTLDVDGRYVLSGVVNATNDFALESTTGSFLGADLTVDETGRIGVRMESGAREGFTVVFARDF